MSRAGSKGVGKAAPGAPSEMEIFRRIVDAGQPLLSPDAARALLRLEFSKADRDRMNELAARNREGRVSTWEEQELDNYIRAGQILGILKSKARRSLQSTAPPSGRKRRKS